MVQSRRSLRFSLKASQCLRVFRDFLRKEFQRDESVQPRVLSLVDHTHPAPAQPLQNAVMGDGLPDERIGVRHSAAILGRVIEASQRTGAFCVKAALKIKFSGQALVRGQAAFGSSFTV